MRKLLTLAAVAFMVAGCGPKSNHKPEPSYPAVDGMKTEIGDGSWVVGDEIAPGRWVPSAGWVSLTTKTNCVWFVSPAKARPSPTAEPTFRNPSGEDVITLHRGEAFTTSHCGKWHRL